NKVIPVGDVINKKLSGNVEFKQDGRRTQARIQFRGREGNLLGGRRINWEANDGWDVFDKGRAQTDEMGWVTIALNNKDSDKFKNGRIVVKLDDTETLVGEYALANAFQEKDFQVFPEGGDLLSGVAKKVAFKAIFSNGKGVSVKGKSIDSKKNEVASFEDLGMGMGYFSLIPSSGESYQAVVEFEDGEESTFDLPEVVDDRINLVAASQDEEYIHLGLVTNDEYFNVIQNKPYYVFGHLNGHLIYAAQASIKSPAVSIRVPLKELPNGIVQLTLLTPDGEPVSERLVFIETQDLIDITVSTDRESYNRKDPAKMKLQFHTHLHS